MGTLLADRLNPKTAAALKVVGHSFEETTKDWLGVFIRNQVIAYEENSEIHLILPVFEELKQWDQDIRNSQICGAFSLTETLLLHELVELVLQETQTALAPLPAHLIATTFERYLNGLILSQVVHQIIGQWELPPLEGQNHNDQIAPSQQPRVGVQGQWFGAGENSSEQGQTHVFSTKMDFHRAPKTVLIVDDSKVIRFTMNEIVKELGHHSIEAANGIEALSAIKIQKPDLILLDILMPKKDGIEVLQALHSNPACDSIPVIVLTTDIKPEIIKEVAALGVKDFIAKPARPEQVKERLIKYLV